MSTATPKYLYSSSFGTSYVDCQLLQHRKFRFKTDATLWERWFKHPRKHRYRNTWGWVIKYYDIALDDVVVQWVPEHLIKFEHNES